MRQVLFKAKRLRRRTSRAVWRCLIYIERRTHAVRFIGLIPGWLRLTGLVLILFGAFIFIYIGTAHADSQGPLSPAAASDYTGTGSVGTIVWGSPSNALTSNGVYAAASITKNAVSHYLMVTNFGFTVPTGSTINGVVVIVQKNAATAANATISDNSVVLVKAGAPGGTSQAVAGTWPSSNTNVTYGSSSNLWGQTLAVSDVNATNFGVAISAKNTSSGGGSTLAANIDYVSVTVYFTPPPIVYGQASFRIFGNQDASTSVTFAKAWGGSSSTETANSLARTSDGGYVVTGDTASFGAGGYDAYVAKYDAAANLQWNTVWGGSATEHARSVIQTSDGGYVLTGSTSSVGAGASDMFLAKFTSAGVLSWNTVWGGTGSDDGYSVVQTSDGNFIVTGESTSYTTSGDTGDMFIAKFSSSGSLSWSTTWGALNSIQIGHAVVQTSDGGYAVAVEGSAGGVSYAYLVKFSGTGSLSWNRRWGGVSSDIAYSVVQTSDGGCALTGSTQSYATGNSDMFLAKYDSSGNLSWSRTWGGTLDEKGNAVVQTSDGGYAISGTTNSFGAGGTDMFLAKYDSSGNLSWSRTWGGSNSEDAFGIIQTPGGSYVLAGDTATYGSGAGSTFDAAIVRFDSSGSISGCGSICSSPSPVVSSPSASTSTTPGTTTSPTATSSSPTAITSTPTATSTTIIAVSPSNIDVGSALAAQNTAAAVSGDGQPFRLRLDINITNYQLGASVGSFKLQYAPMTTSCDASFTNTTSASYKDVTDTSVVRFYDNTNGVSGLLPSTNANDPTDNGNTLVRQTYQEKGTAIFTNPTLVPAGQDGLWDFALTTVHALQNTHYCIRVILSSGTALNTYTTASSASAIAEIITPSSNYTQGSYRVFQGGSSTSTFAKSISGSSTDTNSLNELVATNDGGYAAVGNYSPVISGCFPVCLDLNISDAYLAKFDSSGAMTWQTAWGKSSTSTIYNDFGSAVIQTSDGGYAVAGSTNSFGAGSQNIFIAKYTSTGTLSWNTTIGASTFTSSGQALVQTTDGGYAIAGQTNAFTTNAAAFIAKLDSSGNLLWSRTWGGAAGNDGASSIIQTSDGGLAMAGYTNSNGSGSQDVFIAKYTSTGTLSWNTTWGGSGSEGENALIQTSDGGFAITGNTYSFGDVVNGDAFLAKFNSSGTLSWSRTWGATGTDAGASLVQTSDGGYTIAGSTTSYGAGGKDALLLHYDSSGALQWSRAWGTSSDDSGSSIVNTSDGGYAVAGEVSGYAMLFAKFDAGGGMNNCSASCTSTVPYGATVQSVSATSANPSIATSSPSASATVAGATLTDTLTVSTLATAGNSSSVGSSLTAQNKPYEPVRIGDSNAFRLRLNIGVTNSGMAQSGQSFKLQYALRGSDLTCDTSFAGESYADVTTTTPIHYYDAAANASGDGMTWNANDPSDSSSIESPQTYQEANNFTNSMMPVYASQSGTWAFSLAIASGTLPGTDFCLRAVKSDGSLLNSYTQIVDMAYGPSMMNLLRQEAWWNRSGVRQNFFIKGQ